MSDEQDDPSQKSEQPTHQKLEKAREKGQVAYSKEVGHALILGTVTLLLVTTAPTLFDRIKKSLCLYFEKSSLIFADGQAFLEVVYTCFLDLAFFVGIPGIVLMGVTLLGGFAQTGLVVSTDSMKPKLDKLSPFKGFKRLFSMTGLVEFFKTMTKFALIAVMTYGFISPEFPRLESLLNLTLSAQANYLESIIYKLFLSVACMAAIMAVLDYAYQKYQFIQKLKMSPQEIKDEMKESEGDPHMRAHLRHLRQSRAQRGLAKDVAASTVIVTNPTHYAIALKYDGFNMSAPVLLAKGVDHLALHIRTLAQKSHIPIMEDPVLARALYANVKEGQEIPMEYYEAVAKIMRYVLRIGLKKKSPS
jgi:flagellar biosynthesis protein FlhB